MKIAPFDDNNWMKDHPTGKVVLLHLLKGEPSSPENFMYTLGRQDGDFYMPRHRHNFDQIRLPVVGDMNLSGGLILREGEVGYFPEGVAYGPQDDPLGNAKPGERLMLVLQFGGSSGYGFMSMEQRRKAIEELAKVGKFVGPHYHRPDGTVQWGLNTIWEHVFGVKLKYSWPRYKAPIIADPRRFNWLPIAGASGVDRKFMGSFSERGVWIEMIKLSAHAEWSSQAASALRLIVVLSGDGDVQGQPVSRLSALQVEAGEPLRLTADQGIELFVVGLPPIVLPSKDSDEYDVDELPAEETAA